MTQEFEVTAEELVRTLQRRGIPLPSEIGAFVVLEACEKLIGRPTLISTRDIFITESGDVECEEPKRAEREADAVSALLRVLAELLVCAAPGVPNMLLDLVEHGPNQDRLTLALLRSDLEACLLPLNRGAQRRVLSRLVREVRKSAPGAPGHAVAIEVGDVDATFDDLLGETSPPPGAAQGLPRGIGSDQPRRAAGELPRGVSSSRPADNKAASEIVERSAPLSVDEEVTRHHEVTADERGRARRMRTPVEDEPAPRAREPRGAFAAAAAAAAADADGLESEAERRTARPHGADGGEPSSRRTGRSERERRASGAPESGDSARARRGGAHGDETERSEAGSRRTGRERAASDASERGDPSSASLGRRSARGDAAHGGEPGLRRTGRSERERADGADRGEGRGRSRSDDVSFDVSARGTGASRSARPPSRSRAPVDLDALVETHASRGRVGLWVFLGTTAAAVALLLGYFALGREQSQSALGFLQPREGDAAPTKSAPVPRRAYGDLRVNSQPDRAQVLLLIGPGPALATDIPLGVAQEFIAMADGHRPARALLPADAVWDELNGQPRYELAIQARPLHEGRKPHTPDALGPTLLPQNVGTPTGRLGSVRVVTTPRAAEVYQLIGFTPEVHVDNLPLDHAYELLIHAEGHKTARKHLEPSDFIEQDGKRIARIDVQLPAAD